MWRMSFLFRSGTEGEYAAGDHVTFDLGEPQPGSTENSSRMSCGFDVAHRAQNSPLGMRRMGVQMRAAFEAQAREGVCISRKEAAIHRVYNHSRRRPCSIVQPPFRNRTAEIPNGEFVDICCRTSRKFSLKEASGECRQAMNSEALRRPLTVKKLFIYQ